VFLSEAVLIVNKEIDNEKRALVNQLISRFEAVERSKGMKYLLMNIPLSMVDDAAILIPGMRSPTILPLAQPGWCSMHVVVNENQLWPKLESLKAIGAEGILVLSLDKMMP